MSVNIEQLSAKQLLELANRKLKQERHQEQYAELETRATDLQNARQQLVAAHEVALATIETEFLALKQRRAQVIAEHQGKLSAIEEELAAISKQLRLLSRPAGGIPEEAVRDTVKTTANTPAASLAPTEEDLSNAIIEALKSRPDISESLLREKLRSQGHQLATLNKLLERMMRDGIVSSKGGGNYSLKKRL